MYQALYRKYRPKFFSDVVGQEHITVALKNEIAAAEFSHAYLFTGSRGTGKTTCSKIFAKAVNCPNQKDGDPCGECEICTGIDDGSILDIVEIDAASNNGVDNIRQLREEAVFTPAVTKYRVYIIDETHMLSVGAFNALLKIMEEPPAHVIFILATTEVHKVPATILSRCQRFDFRRIKSDVIAKRLEDIAVKENIRLNDDAALLIARLSDGGMRDAVSLLDLCTSYSDEITVDTVSNASGLVGNSILFDISEAVYNSDAPEALNILEKLAERSVDYERMCEQLINHYRNLMVAKSMSSPGDLIICLPDELKQYQAVAERYKMEYIIHSLEVLQDTLTRISKTSFRKTELEMGIIKLCSNFEDNSSHSGSSVVDEKIIKRIEKLEKALSNAVLSERTVKQERAKTLETAEKVTEAPPPEEIAKAEVVKFNQWADVLDILKTTNPALFGALSGSSAYTGGNLLLIDSKSELFLGFIRENEYAKESLRDAVFKVTNKRFRLGPYKQSEHKIIEADSSALDSFIEKAAQAGVNIEVK